MFVNNFKLSGFCKKKSILKNDNGMLQGFYISLATLGESYGVYIPENVAGSHEIKEGSFYEIEGNLKTKYSVTKNDRVSSIASLGVVSIVEKADPFNKK